MLMIRFDLREKILILSWRERETEQERSILLIEVILIKEIETDDKEAKLDCYLLGENSLSIVCIRQLNKN
jgi:hypothetical protein